jgi:hypothetical protein
MMSSKFSQVFSLTYIPCGISLDYEGNATRVSMRKMRTSMGPETGSGRGAEGLPEVQKPVLEHAEKEAAKGAKAVTSRLSFVQNETLPQSYGIVKLVTEGEPSSREHIAVRSENGSRRREHYGYASTSALASSERPHYLRVSLVLEALREIRNLFRRIGEIQNRLLDRRGISINPSHGISLPPEQQETALACCIQDMRSLYKSRPHASLIDAELYLQGWQSGAASALRNWSIQPPA